MMAFRMPVSNPRAAQSAFNSMQHRTLARANAAAERAILASPVGDKFPLRLRAEPAFAVAGR
jgi:hypothetical protein